MDHQQIEDKLTDACEIGACVSRIENARWKQAVEQTLDETKGIGPGRKELFLERLKLKLAAGQKMEKLQ